MNIKNLNFNVINNNIIVIFYFHLMNLITSIIKFIKWRYNGFNFYTLFLFLFDYQ